MAAEVNHRFNFLLNGKSAVGRLGEIFRLAVGAHSLNLVGGVNALLFLILFTTLLAVEISIMVRAIKAGPLSEGEKVES